MELKFVGCFVVLCLLCFEFVLMIVFCYVVYGGECGNFVFLLDDFIVFKVYGVL